MSILGSNKVRENVPAGPWGPNSTKAVRSAFFLSAPCFGLVCAVALILTLALREIVPAGLDRWHFFSEGNDYWTLLILLIVGLVVALGSSMLAWQAATRVSANGSSFVLLAAGGHVLGLGIGFGLLFTSLQIYEAPAIFGIGAGIFAVMGAAGLLVKDGRGPGRMLTAGLVAALVCAGVAVALYFTDVYEELWLLLVNVLAGFFFVGYAALDIAVLRRTKE